MTKLNLRPEELAKIRELAHFKTGKKYLFLGYSLDLDTAELRDLFSSDDVVSRNDVYVLTVIFSHYASADPKARTGKLIKFKDLPGGRAYETALIKRAVDPIAKVFGDDPSSLLDAAKPLGGKSLSHGDSAVEISALEGIPIVYILWGASEFSASANVFFDCSASAYLPTEDIAVLTELTSARLIKSCQNL